MGAVSQLIGEVPAPRHWGQQRAVLDDQEARRLLLAAAERCIVRRGSAEIRMGEVAAEAGVARSTLYRYFPSRSELIIGLLLGRADLGLKTLVHSLPDPTDPARALPDLVLGALDLVQKDALNKALYLSGPAMLLSAVELNSEPLLDVCVVHVGPLLNGWRAAGLMHPDIDTREAVRWLNTVALAMLSLPWRQRTKSSKRHHLEQFVARAFVVDHPALGQLGRP